MYGILISVEFVWKSTIYWWLRKGQLCLHYEGKILIILFKPLQYIQIFIFKISLSGVYSSRLANPITFIHFKQAFQMWRCKCLMCVIHRDWWYGQSHRGMWLVEFGGLALWTSYWDGKNSLLSLNDIPTFVLGKAELTCDLFFWQKLVGAFILM